MPISGAVPILSNWTPPATRAARSRREVAVIAFFSVLVHGGIAGAAYAERDTPRTSKRLSRVEIDLSRPPVAKKAVVPPPPEPPKPLEQVAKPLAARPLNEPTPTPSATPAAPVPDAPIDTGSSAPAAEDGELFAGSGGLGTAAPPPPPAPQAPSAPKAEPVIQAREGANYLKNPRPAYPGRARREGWEGTTLLRVQVSPSGRPGAIQIQRSSGRHVLDEAATEAVKRWSFTPASQGGNPVSGWVTVPIVFKLQ